MRSGSRSRGAEWIKLPRTDRTMATPAGGHAERPEAPAQLHGRTATLAREELQGVVILQPLGEELRALRPHRPELLTQRLEYQDRKSTRLNSSHSQISYAVFCLE